MRSTLSSKTLHQECMNYKQCLNSLRTTLVYMIWTDLHDLRKAGRNERMTWGIHTYIQEGRKEGRNDRMTWGIHTYRKEGRNEGRKEWMNNERFEQRKREDEIKERTYCWTNDHTDRCFGEVVSASARREFEPHQRLLLFPWAKKSAPSLLSTGFFQEMDSSMILELNLNEFVKNTTGGLWNYVNLASLII